jgi:chromosomal replication initiation ATPase DnaA
MITHEEFAKKIGISVEDMFSKSRRPEYVAARQVWWFYLSSLGYGFKEMERIYGWDHSTVMHGVRKIGDLIRLRDKYIDRYLSAIDD